MDYDIFSNTQEECLKYWKNPKDHNISSNYNREHTQQRSKYLKGMFDKYQISKESNILEIGCNCGRNLNYLFDAGYHFLNGIEINKSALKNMKEFFPKLKANCINGPIEDNILFYKNDEFDVVYTMAVIQHIHIDSNWIFEHISRICKTYLILIELDTRDYENIFNKLGFKLLEKRNCTKIKGLEKYKFRIFKKNE